MAVIIHERFNPMSSVLSFSDLAKTIGPVETESKISCSYRLPEAVVVSINSLAKITGAGKSEIVSSLLEIGCTQLADAIEKTRPDLANEELDEETGQSVFELCSPEMARQIRNKFGKSAQLDTSDEAY
jgi:hypothetical protein